MSRLLVIATPDHSGCAEDPCQACVDSALYTVESQRRFDETLAALRAVEQHDATVGWLTEWATVPDEPDESFRVPSATLREIP